ncbi:ABC transporter ATP-binding protein [bacterium]|nr:ABC transporter ATP-binding protein [bacterium]
MPSLLDIKNLKTFFHTQNGIVKAVNDVNLSVQKKSIHALVGESGSGKSMTALSILNLISEPGRIEDGEIIFTPHDNERIDLLSLTEKEMQAVRGKRIAMIFQEPMTSLNPVYTIGDQIAEAVLVHEKVSKQEALKRSIDMLQKVGIPNPERRVHDYPHQMSGGMRQRVMIAMALSLNPELLIADEPTTALDVTIQAQILDLIHQLIDDLNMTLLLITHDFGIVAEHAQDVSVMYAGEVVEQGKVTEIFDRPMHPYTKGLLESIPSLKKQGEKKLKSIPGVVPNLSELPAGCYFGDRCERVFEDCRLNHPWMLGDKNKAHRARCFKPY